MWIDLNGSKFNTDTIACVRPVGNGEDQTIIFTTGQDAASGGFLVDVAFDEVFTAIQHSRLVELAAMMDSENDSASDDERSTGTESS